MAGLLAVACGAVIYLRPKGVRSHRRLGLVYLALLALCNASIIELPDRGITTSAVLGAACVLLMVINALSIWVRLRAVHHLTGLGTWWITMFIAVERTYPKRGPVFFAFETLVGMVVWGIAIASWPRQAAPRASIVRADA
jgi:hypothetical protein